jgi:type III pantothenate kinase
MSMNVVIDIGNSRQKVGFFQHTTLKEKKVFSDLNTLLEALRSPSHVLGALLVSSVVPLSEHVLTSLRALCRRVWVLDANLALPIQIRYRTPHTLGVDRLAAACGAQHFFPRTNCLVIDAGTCINYEFVDADGNYLGGAISPGVSMRLQAMHQLTAKLPLLSPEANPPWLGQDTASCMLSGAVVGAWEEINGFIARYQSQYAPVQVIMTGGDVQLFESQLKPAIFVAPDLVLVGLNRILMHHVE